MTTATFEMTRTDNLAFANRIRLEQAAIRREIYRQSMEEGLVMAAHLLMDPPLAVQRMTTKYLLDSIRKVGPKVRGRLLMSVGISENKQIGPDASQKRLRDCSPLTARQREMLACTLIRKAKAHRAREQRG